MDLLVCRRKVPDVPIQSLLALLLLVARTLWPPFEVRVRLPFRLRLFECGVVRVTATRISPLRATASKLPGLLYPCTTSS